MKAIDRLRLARAGIMAGSVVARAIDRLHLTPAGASVLVMAILGWFLARVMGSRTAFLLVYSSVLVLALTWVVGRRSLSMSLVRSELPERMRVGQFATVQLEVASRSRVSTVLLTEHLPEQFGTDVVIPVAALRPSQTLEHEYSFTPALRGAYEVGPVVATWSDPFGLTIQRRTVLDAVEVLVHPLVETSRDRVLTRMWEDPPIRPPVSKPWPVGFEFYGMRDYVPGDDLRRIVWSTVAKTGRMMVRESEQGITDRVVIAIETGSERHSPGQVSESFETAIRVAAAVGVQHLEDGFSVTLMTSETAVLEGLRGQTARMEFLDALARMQRTGGTLNDRGFDLLERARTRPHVFVITPDLDLKGAQQLKLVRDRGVSVAAAMVQWDECDPTSPARAASVGCRVYQVPAGAPLASVFVSDAVAGVRR